MLKSSVAAWVVAVMLPTSYVGYKSATTGKFFGIPLSAKEARPRPVLGVPPSFGHPLPGKLAQVNDCYIERDEEGVERGEYCP